MCPLYQIVHLYMKGIIQFFLGAPYFVCRLPDKTKVILYEQILCISVALPGQCTELLIRLLLPLHDSLPYRSSQGKAA